MTRADNTWFLAQAALAKASQAIKLLDSSGQPVTFSAAAAAAESPGPGSTATPAPAT
jgi:hypothetical protein